MIIDHCQIEWQEAAGVLYVHGPHGRTVIRISKIPIRKPVAAGLWMDLTYNSEKDYHTADRTDPDAGIYEAALDQIERVRSVSRISPRVSNPAGLHKKPGPSKNKGQTKTAMQDLLRKQSIKDY